ncbi:MAG TPA: hypothetical protein VIV54_11620 [Burkholderiales bacterium]
MRPALALVVLLLGGGCANLWDIHAPRTVSVGPGGGAVTVNHGERLRIGLASDASGYEWRRVEPPVMMVVMEGPPDAQGFNFTPVRSGEEKLRFEHRPASGEGTADRVLSYDITVR